jgi:hypothetical protein
MARRSGSAILPLHGGRVPPWLATRIVLVRAENEVNFLSPEANE